LALTPTLTINNHPQPARASLAIEASEEANRQFGGGQGAVAIVLDASGSMGPAAGGTYSSDTKYAVAVRALADVLGGIPAGTSVSLWTFGKALGSEKTVAAAERTIERVLPPTKWDPQVGRDELVHRISYPQTEPWNESPIVRTMLAAKGDLDQAAGPKTLIVITDGADNRFADDPALNPQREEIADVLLRRFGSSGITVHVVGFRTVDAEQGQFQEQFAVVRNFYPPGDFYFVEQADMLRKTLAAPLRQTLRYHLRLADGSPAAKVPHQGQPAALAGADDRWLQPGLPPGDYAVSFGNAAEPRYEVLLERGDLLLLTLGVRQHAIALKRAPFLATRFQQRPSLHVGGWHLAMLQNQALAGGHLQMLLALEADPPTDDSVLGIKRPRRLWLEVTPADKPMTPSSWRWYSAGGYPVPAVAMELFGWPSKSSDNTSERPIVQLWWSMNEEAAGGVTLRRGDDFQSVEQLAGRDLHLHDGPVTLDAVAVEEHAVEVAPGQRELRSCLAVRLRHDPRQRYWVTLDGPRTEGLEQRFYEQAGSYTALFWPVTESQTDQLAAIRIESIETFKKVAAQRGQTASFEHLPPPSPDDARPRPALALPR